MRIFFYFFLDFSIDFFNYYWFVDLMNFDGYVKVFVVEDIDYDIVLNFFVYNFFVFC